MSGNFDTEYISYILTTISYGVLQTIALAENREILDISNFGPHIGMSQAIECRVLEKEYTTEGHPPSTREPGMLRMDHHLTDIFLQEVFNSFAGARTAHTSWPSFWLQKGLAIYHVVISAGTSIIIITIQIFSGTGALPHYNIMKVWNTQSVLLLGFHMS